MKQTWEQGERSGHYWLCIKMDDLSPPHNWSLLVAAVQAINYSPSVIAIVHNMHFFLICLELLFDVMKTSYAVMSEPYTHLGGEMKGWELDTTAP